MGVLRNVCAVRAALSIGLGQLVNGGRGRRRGRVIARGGGLCRALQHGMRVALGDLGHKMGKKRGIVGY